MKGGDMVTLFLKKKNAGTGASMKPRCWQETRPRGSLERRKCGIGTGFNVSSGVADKLSAREALWGMFLADPSQWWDNRSNKRKLKYPDFVHSTTREGLWLDSSLNPFWVDGKVANLLAGPTVGACRVSFRLPLADPHAVVNGSDHDFSVRVSGRAQASFNFEGWNDLCNEGRLSEALQALDLLSEQGTPVSSDKLYLLLKACIKMKDLIIGRHVHALVGRCGYESNMFLGNHIIRMYASHGRLLEANLVFGKMSSPTIFMWTSIISAHVEYGEAEQALKLYRQMQQSGPEPDEYLFVAALKACASAADLRSGKLVHADVVAKAVESNVFVGNGLVDMYCKCKSLLKAHEVFNRLPKKNVATWTCMIGGYAQWGYIEEALKLYFAMQENGLVPDAVTVVCILRSCGSKGDLQAGKQIHMEVLHMGMLDVFVGNALVDMYIKCGSLEEAREVFGEMSSRNIATWNTMLAGYAQYNQAEEALKLAAILKTNNMMPDDVTFVSILKACSSLGALQEGREIHAQVLEQGLESNGFVGNALVDMYAKCGSLENAKRVFSRLVKKDVGTWTALINGYGLHNDCRMAIRCFEEMIQQGLLPDATLFCCLLVACSHVGLVNEGEHYFKLMLNEYGIMPGVEHYTCMVDLLGRAGHLEEAESMWRVMPFDQDSVGWLSLLNSCKTHNNFELGKLCFNRLVQIEPTGASGYVLMASIYAEADRWKDARDIEAARRRAAAQKKPALAIIEVNNTVHEFTVGQKGDDTSAKLRSLSLQTVGDKYMGQQVLVEKEEPLEQPEFGLKLLLGRNHEDPLCGHAEKLAVAFGLLNTSKSATLFITKNLRMCSQCHTGTKTISRLEGREIIVRDSHRVHHFKDGSCSCGDYSY